MITHVPIHGSWKADFKDKHDITFLSVNVNSLTHWSQESNRAESLKHIFKKYSIDSAGLQEVCMNWAQLPPSMTLAQILRRIVENIRSVASYNKMMGQRSRGREGPTERCRHNIERRTDGIRDHLRS